ncbi:hypothetical protein ACT17_32655 [Mycolicibacterium conceptionense]|uniref:DUF1508 domain-containing protein n=1 Tax=Mycolicibacterium conceptionense TaxID=451644 RepID=A0A0J8WLP3_9MYCO|nr:hypothetical protein [Mycolicibacterium conceptionense]KMV13934.1 hypothetical protein ACT17_32655 [Mycolicibacterium conceptionense]
MALETITTPDEDRDERFIARVTESFEQPGQWYWCVVDTTRGEGPEAVVESGYRGTDESAGTAGLAALIRRRATEDPK